MKIPYKHLLLLVFLYFTAVFFVGCVDTSVNPIPDRIDYSSQMKVVNLATGASSATLTLDGQSLGAVSFGGEIPGSGSGFLTVPSGSRNLVASFDNGQSKTFRFSAATEYKFRAFLIGASTNPSLIVVNQRYIWQTKDSENGQKLFPADTAWVSIFNGSPDIVINSVEIGTELNEFETALETGKSSGYLKNAAGNYTITITYNDTETLSFAYSLSARNRYTVALYDAAAQLKYAVLLDD
jgi:hypothetical protein